MFVRKSVINFFTHRKEYGWNASALSLFSVTQMVPWRPLQPRMNCSSLCLGLGWLPALKFSWAQRDTLESGDTKLRSLPLSWAEIRLATVQNWDHSLQLIKIWSKNSTFYSSGISTCKTTCVCVFHMSNICFLLGLKLIHIAGLYFPLSTLENVFPPTDNTY